ncbi:MAG: hypothetical protein A2073_02195 [Deltaproteobacteria bacterium GWC2_42_11]|nr:MAG: hypothetical protein A2073_02195 [Deltaproteobacteria bacterium GWC2_42_11]HBO84754.1 heterodisulfide reductase subunit B [Deltaproteobacteria bacterium]
MRYAYYPGCASQVITKEYSTTTKKVCQILGIGLEEMKDANCCGAGLMTDYNYELSLALNARIFAQAEKMSLDIITICSTCFMVMSRANRDLKEKPELLEKINNVLKKAGLRYSGNVRVKHFLFALIEDYGLKKLKKMVKKPLKDMKVAPYYGCHILRPSYAEGFDDPEKPSSLERLIEALGADVTHNEGKTKCCGFQIVLVTQTTAVDMIGKRLKEAKDSGAQCIVSPCPLCHISLDSYQGEAEKRTHQKLGVPVLHLSQLVGLALGISANELEFSRHLVSPEAVIMRFSD